MFRCSACGAAANATRGSARIPGRRCVRWTGGLRALAEPPQQVAFVPSWPLRLRLDPDGGPFADQEDGWRQKIDLPVGRLV